MSTNPKANQVQKFIDPSVQIQAIALTVCAIPTDQQQALPAKLI